MLKIIFFPEKNNQNFSRKKKYMWAYPTFFLITQAIPFFLFDLIYNW